MINASNSQVSGIFDSQVSGIFDSQVSGIFDSQVSGIFDSHAHYDDIRFDADREIIIGDLGKSGVVNVINIGCDIKSSLASIELAQKYDFFYASVGVHPHEASGASADYIDRLAALLQDEKVVAVGEIGLDYHYDYSPRGVQQSVFEQQLILAKKCAIPVIIHSREATADTMELLMKYRPSGVVHCFSGSKETALKTIEIGMYIGITGVVTFKNAKKVHEVVKAVPMERILLETDCPYMAPEPHRGKRCTSDLIVYTATAIAAIKGIPVQRVIDIANENTRRLFIGK